MLTASVLSCSNDLISAGASALRWRSLRQGLGQAAGLSRGKGEEAEGNSPKTLTHWGFLFCFVVLNSRI